MCLAADDGPHSKCRHLCVKMQQCMQCRQGKTLFTKCRSCEGCICANLCRSNRSKTQTTQPDGEKKIKDGLEPVRNISLQRRWLCHSRTSLMDSKNQEPKWDGMGFASALGSRYSVKPQGLAGVADRDGSRSVQGRKKKTC